MKKIFLTTLLFCCISPMNKIFAQYGIEASYTHDFFDPIHISKLDITNGTTPKGIRIGFFTFKDSRLMYSYSLIYSASTLGSVQGIYSIPGPFGYDIQKAMSSSTDASQLGLVLESQELMSGELDEKSYFYAIRGFGIRRWSFTTTYALDNSVTNASTIADFNLMYPTLSYTGYEFNGVYGFGYQFNFNTKFGAFVDAKLNYGLGYVSAADNGLASTTSSSSLETYPHGFFYSFRICVDIGIRARIK